MVVWKRGTKVRAVCFKKSAYYRLMTAPYYYPPPDSNVTNDFTHHISLYSHTIHKQTHNIHLKSHKHNHNNHATSIKRTRNQTITRPFIKNHSFTTTPCLQQTPCHKQTTWMIKLRSLHFIAFATPTCTLVAIPRQHHNNTHKYICNTRSPATTHHNTHLRKLVAPPYIGRAERAPVPRTWHLAPFARHRNHRLPSVALLLEHCRL